MFPSLFYSALADSFYQPMRTVYVVSDSQLEELKRKQHQEALDDLGTSRKRLEESYQAQLKAIDQREGEIKKELKALTAAK